MTGRRKWLAGLIGALPAIAAKGIHDPQWKQCRDAADYPSDCVRKPPKPGECPQCGEQLPEKALVYPTPLGQLARCASCNTAFWLDYEPEDK